MTKLKLNREIQCAKCPWRKSTNPRLIPNGYCELSISVSSRLSLILDR